MRVPCTGMICGDSAVAQRSKVRACAVGNYIGKRGFSAAGRAPQQNGREEAVGFNGAPQQAAFADYFCVANELRHRARAHARSQRCLAAQTLLQPMLKQIHCESPGHVRFSG